jgi:hypothetical protein
LRPAQRAVSSIDAVDAMLSDIFVIPWKYASSSLQDRRPASAIALGFVWQVWIHHP